MGQKGPVASIRIYDSLGNDITPVNDLDTLVAAFQQLIKRVESLSVTDINQRQRVNIDSVAAIISTIGTAISGLTSGAGVSAPNIVTPAAPCSANAATTYYQQVWVGPVDQRWLAIDQARNTYANSIRSNLV